MVEDKQEKIEETKEEKKTEESISLSTFSISFGDLSNLESLVNEADEKMAKKGFNVEHFSEMRKILKKVKNSKSA